MGFKGLSLARAQAQSGNGVSRLWGVLAGGGGGFVQQLSLSQNSVKLRLLPVGAPEQQPDSGPATTRQEVSTCHSDCMRTCVGVRVCVCMYVCTAQYPDLSKWESVVKV